MRNKIDQAWQDRAKMIRAAIRMKHSLAADAEINEKLEAEKTRFYRAAQHGNLLSPLGIAAVVND